ncbi:MAG: hypothetical protein INQ03_08740 [Candidatus Heimdallarchaeota archaeon]|nr:hypothetical protein [Candidatus Heimdallarchaeota archaeon]
MSEENPGIKFCRRCGNSIKSPDARFCGKCGLDLLIKSQPGPPSTPASNPVIPPSGASSPPYQTPVSPEAQIPAFRPQVPPASSRKIVDPANFRLEKSSFDSTEYSILLKTVGVLFISHFLRIMLIYNKFPTLIEILIALPFYIGIVAIMEWNMLNFYNTKGVYIESTTTNYHLMQSLVTSSFFISVIPIVPKPNIKMSVIPEELSIIVKQNNITGYQNIPRLNYVETYLKQRHVFREALVMLIISFFITIAYVLVDVGSLNTTLRVILTFTAGKVVADSAPIFGRTNSLMSSLYKYRTLMVFLLGFFLFIVGIFSEIFLLLLIGLIF